MGKKKKKSLHFLRVCVTRGREVVREWDKAEGGRKGGGDDGEAEVVLQESEDVRGSRRRRQECRREQRLVLTRCLVNLHGLDI